MRTEGRATLKRIAVIVVLGVVAIYDHAAALMAGPEVFGAASGAVDWADAHLTDARAILIGAAVLAAVAFAFGLEVRREDGEGARKRVLGGAVLTGAAAVALILVSLGGPPGLEGPPEEAIADNEAVAVPSKHQGKQSKARKEQGSGSRQDEEESPSGAIASAESEPESDTSTTPFKGGSSSSSPCGCSQSTQSPPEQLDPPSEGGGASPEVERFEEESLPEEEPEEPDWEEEWEEEEWEEEW